MVSQFQKDDVREVVERNADAKGIELEEIEVIEETTDDGEDVLVVRAYETYSENEEEAVGIQVTKMASSDDEDIMFRDRVQQKLSALKQHVNGSSPQQQLEEEDNKGSPSDDERRRTRTTRDTSGGGVGSQLDAEIEAIHDRLDDLEARIAELEEKGEALDGLQKLMSDSD